MSRKPTDKAHFKPSTAARDALGEHGFVPHIVELIRSDAWRARSINLVRMLDRLEVEHIQHAGKENGCLNVTYKQFAEWGIGRRFIKITVEEGERLGLLKVTSRGRYQHAASAYQLTYLPWKFAPAVGPPQYLQPAHEWRSFVIKPAKRETKARPKKMGGEVVRLATAEGRVVDRSGMSGGEVA